MRRRTIFLLSLTFPAAHAVLASGIEGIAGASYESRDTGDSYGGLSLRFRWVSESEGGGGFFVQGNFPGVNAVLTDAIAGYMYRTRGRLFFEVGAGARYGSIWGFGAGFLAGAGLNLDKNWYLVFPVIYRRWIEYVPYIGMRF